MYEKSPHRRQKVGGGLSELRNQMSLWWWVVMMMIRYPLYYRLWMMMQEDDWLMMQDERSWWRWSIPRLVENVEKRKRTHEAGTRTVTCYYRESSFTGQRPDRLSECSSHSSEKRIGTGNRTWGTQKMSWCIFISHLTLSWGTSSSDHHHTVLLLLRSLIIAHNL